jgi:hypothetical protein
MDKMNSIAFQQKGIFFEKDKKKIILKSDPSDLVSKKMIGLSSQIPEYDSKIFKTFIECRKVEKLAKNKKNISDWRVAVV